LAREIVLVLRNLAVGEHQPPHHFGEDHLLPEIVAALQDRGEAKVIH
jgi:hypothetical protein